MTVGPFFFGGGVPALPFVSVAGELPGAGVDGAGVTAAAGVTLGTGVRTASGVATGLGVRTGFTTGWALGIGLSAGFSARTTALVRTAIAPARIGLEVIEDGIETMERQLVGIGVYAREFDCANEFAVSSTSRTGLEAGFISVTHCAPSTYPPGAVVCMDTRPISAANDFSSFVFSMVKVS